MSDHQTTNGNNNNSNGKGNYGNNGKGKTPGSIPYEKMARDTEEEDIMNGNHNLLPHQMGEQKLPPMLNDMSAIHSDRGEGKAYQDQKQEEYERSQNTKLKKWVNPNNMLDWGIEALKKVGVVEVIENPKSKLGAKIELGLKTRFEKDLSDYGLYTPNHEVILPVIHNNRELVGEFGTVSDNSGKCAEYKKSWTELLCGMSTAGNLPLRQIIGATELPKSRIVSLTGKELAHKKVFALDCFDKRIKTLTPAQIVPLFNDAELDTLMISLGRALAGVSVANSKLNCSISEKQPINRIAEEFMTKDNENIKIPNDLVFSSRVIPVLTGSGGTGKSTLLSHIKGAMESCGYLTGAITLSKNQFGWEAAEYTDLLFSDDLSKKALYDFMGSAQLKSIASSGSLAMERKGENQYTGQAIASVMLLCNELSIDARMMDEGIRTRFHFLQTKELEVIIDELGAEYPVYLEQLAEKHQTTVEILFCYFLRLCLNKFLAEIGYEYDDKKLAFRKIPENNTIRRTLETNAKQYIANIRPNYEQDIMIASRKLIAINKVVKREGWFKEETFLNPCANDDKSFSFGHVYQLTQFASALCYEISKCYKYEDTNCDEVQPEKAERLKELTQLAEWVLPSKYFNLREMSGWHHETTEVIGKNKTARASKLWNDRIEELVCSGSNNLSKDDRYYHRFGNIKTRQNSYENEFTGMFESFTMGVKGVCVSSGAKYYSCQDNISLKAAREGAVKEMSKLLKREKVHTLNTEASESNNEPIAGF